MLFILMFAPVIRASPTWPSPYNFERDLRDSNNRSVADVVRNIYNRMGESPEDGEMLSPNDRDNIRSAAEISQQVLDEALNQLNSQNMMPPNNNYDPYPNPPANPGYDPYPKPNPPPKRNDSLGLQLGLGLGLGIPLCLAIFACILFLIFRHFRRLDRRRNSALVPMPIPKTMNQYEKHENSPTSSICDEWELPRTNLSIDYDNKLGSGAFCNVFRGRIMGEAPVSRISGTDLVPLRDCDVAVKMLPSFADDIAKSDFLQEINFMKSLSYHPHLVSMLGFVNEKNNPLLLVEFCERGDLLHLIREKRQEIIEGPLHPNGLKIKDLLSFSWQISNGLEYLNSVGCIHRDVAARNVLVDALNVCKIADFGLCRLTDSLLYTARGGRLPLKWMAPESLSTYEYTFKTDVWSYGVLLWELFSLGEVPYAGIQTSDLYPFLQANQRLAEPQLAPESINEIMADCWQFESNQRPSFTQIGARLSSLLELATESYGYLVPVSKSSSEMETDYV